LKMHVSMRGRKGIAGGLSGSFPLWHCYQPFRFLSWGCKFMADALMLELRLKRSVAPAHPEVFRCAS